jgi:hypothetical protein
MNFGLRHREQSEATQTKGLQLRLSLGCFAVARNDDLSGRRVHSDAALPPS